MRSTWPSSSFETRIMSTSRTTSASRSRSSSARMLPSNRGSSNPITMICVGPSGLRMLVIARPSSREQLLLRGIELGLGERALLDQAAQRRELGREVGRRRRDRRRLRLTLLELGEPLVLRVLLVGGALTGSAGQVGGAAEHRRTEQRPTAYEHVRSFQLSCDLTAA